MSAAVSASTEPLFIVGAERSGTTLLRLMLDAHSDICIPPESIFFNKLALKWSQCSDISERLDEFADNLFRCCRKFQDFHLEKSCVIEELQALPRPLLFPAAIASVYRLYMKQDAPVARIWGDKNPLNISEIKFIHTHFPDARIVHIIRDIRGVYHSLKERQIKQSAEWKGWRDGVWGISQKWAWVERNAHQYADDPRYHELKYETLVANPETELRRVCEFLGIEFEQSMLEYHKKSDISQRIHRNGINHENIRKPVTDERTGVWQTGLSRGEIEALEILNQHVLTKLGYACVAQGFPWRGGLLLIGHLWRDREVLIRRAKRLLFGNSVRG